MPETGMTEDGWKQEMKCLRRYRQRSVLARLAVSFNQTKYLVIISLWTHKAYFDRESRRLAGWTSSSARDAISRSCRRVPEPTCLPAT